MMEMRGNSDGSEIFLGKLSKHKELKSVARASSGLSKRMLTRYSHSLPASMRARRSQADPGIGLSSDIDIGAAGNTVALETSLEDKGALLEGDGIIDRNIEDKRADSLQAPSQGNRVPTIDGQVAVILSKVTFSSIMEGSGGSKSKNSITEPNQNIEVMEAPAATCLQMLRDGPSDDSKSHLPLKKPKSLPIKEAIQQDKVPRQHVSRTSTGDNETASEREMVTDLEEKQRECVSLDAMTLSTQEICKDTYQRLDHLEETIRDLELSISQISCQGSTELMFPQNFLQQPGPKDVKKGERKMDAIMSKCSKANFANVELDCQDLKLHEARSSPAETSSSSSKPPLLPKPQFLFNSNLQVHVFDISLVLLLTL